MVRFYRYLCVLLLASGIFASGQQDATGLYPFGSFDSKGFDSINVGNLNTHFAIPIVSKPGRGLDFNYSLAYDSLVWSPVSTAGSTYWQPNAGWGFTAVLGNGIHGYVTYTVSTNKCSVPTD